MVAFALPFPCAFVMVALGLPYGGMVVVEDELLEADHMVMSI